MNLVTHIDAANRSEKPAPFAEIEKIINEKAKDFFPYFYCKFEYRLGHCISISGSFEPREKWANGIYQNSPNFHAHIFCTTMYFTDHPNQAFDFKANCSYKLASPMRAKKREKNPRKIADYVVKQLEKLRDANQHLVK